MNKVWKKVKRIEGRYSVTRTHVLSNSTCIISDLGDIANLFCKKFSVISHGSNFPQFLQNKRRVERALSYFEGRKEDYNMHFTLVEMRNALNHFSNTAAGDDQIYFIC